MTSGISFIILRLYKSVILLTVFFFHISAAPVTISPPDSGCIKWRDSLVVAGMRSLDSSRFSDARSYFAGAFKCGIPLDSMHYLIAELYLRQMALDTALVYNQAVGQAGSLPREMWAVQRAKIYWLLGKKQQADSILSTLQKKDRHDFSISFSGTRNLIALNKFTFIPQHLLLSPENDTDDIGGQNIFYKYSTSIGKIRLPWSVQFSANSFLSVPTRHYIDEETDTLYKTYGLSSAIGTIGATTAFSAGIRFRIHADGKIDSYRNACIYIPVVRKNLLMLSYDEKWVDDTTLDDSRTDLSWLFFLYRKKHLSSFNLTLSHHFARSDIYQSRLDSSGIYRPLPKGYINMDNAAFSDTSKPAMRYYKDEKCTEPFGAIPRNDWNKQPSMYFMTAPEHDINASLKYTLSYFLPFRITIGISGYIQSIYYPEKVTWYTTDNTVLASKSPQEIFRMYAIVHNMADGKYYLCADRTQKVYNTNNFVELHYHEKRRLDTYFLLSSTIRKAYRDYGDFYGTVSFTRGFSTLSDNDPMVTFKYAWEFIAGWKKDISVEK